MHQRWNFPPSLPLVRSISLRLKEKKDQPLRLWADTARPPAKETVFRRKHQQLLFVAL